MYSGEGRSVGWFTLDRKYWRKFGFLAAFFQLWGATIFWISGYVTGCIIYVLGLDINTDTSSFTALPSISCPGLAEETVPSGHHKSSETQISPSVRKATPPALLTHLVSIGSSALDLPVAPLASEKAAAVATVYTEPNLDVATQAPEPVVASPQRLVTTDVKN